MRPRSAALLLLGLLAIAAALPAGEEEPITPDRPAHVALVTQQALDLALQPIPAVRIEALERAADQRVLELREIVKRGQADWIGPLASAYARLLKEGAEALIVDCERKSLEITAALVAAEKRTRRHPALLDELALGAAGPAEAELLKAAAAAKEHRAMLTRALERARKERGGLPGEGTEEEMSAEGSGGAREGDGFSFDLGDLKPGSGKAGNEEERRKGRGE